MICHLIDFYAEEETAGIFHNAQVSILLRYMLSIIIAMSLFDTLGVKKLTALSKSSLEIFITKNIFATTEQNISHFF